MTDTSRLGTLAVLNGFYLKIIAVVTMVIDHVGLIFLPGEMEFRIIGRLAFPIYCFLLVEGFYHTKDIGKYIKRIAIFALISELPYDMLISNSILDLTKQNVFFTLLIGLLTIYFINRTFNELWKMIILAIGMVVSIVLLTDYSCYGVAIIYIFYTLRDRRWLACLGASFMGLMMGFYQWFAALAMIPIMMYNGKKGPKIADNKLVKYGFYWVYPVHFLVIWFIKLCIYVM